MPPRFSRPLDENPLSGGGRGRQTRSSPCEAECPAGNPIQKVHSLVLDDRLEEALEYLRARNPFPGMTGRICPHPCEARCNRGRYDEGVAIRTLERFASDRADASRLPRPPKASSGGGTVAVVGAGPAGLCCAHFATLLGHEVTVFEASPAIGGIPRLAVPDFRLPKDVVDREVGRVLEAGFRVRTRTAVGTDVALRELVERFDACVIATGAWKERRIEVPGGELATPALSFLKAVNLGRREPVGDTVVVLGGGGVAFDAAFTARRLGAKEVHVICLEGPTCMCAPEDEVREAAAEGIRVHNSRTVTRILHRDGRVEGIETVAVRSFRFDEGGVLRAELDPAGAIRLDADAVIGAVGLVPELPFLREFPELERTARGTLKVDPVTMATPVPGLFAAGDVVSGPSLLARAIGSGRAAATAVDRYLRRGRASTAVAEEIARAPEASGDGAPHVVEYAELLNTLPFEKMPRQPSTRLDAPGEAPPFAEVDGGFPAEAALAEAGRCFQCGRCTSCGTCVDGCPGHILAMTPDGPEVAYPEECWHCGCCRIGCPSGAVSYEFPLHMLV